MGIISNYLHIFKLPMGLPKQIGYQLLCLHDYILMVLDQWIIIWTTSFILFIQGQQSMV